MRLSNPPVDRGVTVSDRHVTIPDRLESARAKLVYLALAVAGPTTVDDLAARLGETRLALLAVLEAMEDRGLVERGPDGFTAV